MPRVLDYAPAWLSRPSPGATFFSSSGSKKIAGKNAESYFGRTSVLARRGTEVFAVVDNEIRWANLAMLKDTWQEDMRQKRNGADQGNEACGKSVSLVSGSSNLSKAVPETCASLSLSREDDTTSSNNVPFYRVSHF